MARCVRPLLLSTLSALLLASCGRFDHAERPAWRNQAEEACLAQHLVTVSDAIQPSRPIEGPGICGLNHPFRVYALAGGSVKLKSASVLDCSMIPTLDTWIKEVVQPDAMARFGEPVAQINTMGTYSCRGINNMSGASLSEHAFANAIDIGGFVLASGRELNVMRGWKSPDEQESAFLHDSHAGACTYFTTVLGPGANVFHYNHIHMDLAMHGNTSRGPRRYCKPVPQAMPEAPRRDNLPDPPPIEEEMDMAQAPIPAPSYSDGSGRSFVASAPDLPASGLVPRTTPHPASLAAIPPRPGITAAPRPDDAAVGATGESLDVEQLGPSSADLAPTPRRRAYAPADVRPAEWDITSLIKRETR